MTNVNSLLTQKCSSDWLKTAPLFAQLPVLVLHQLNEGSERIQYDDGQNLFAEGSNAQHYFLVLAGKVEVLRYGVDGEERVFSVFEQHQLVALPAMFMVHGRYPMNARCQNDAVLLRLQRKPLQEVCLQHADLCLQIMHVLGATVYQHVNEVEWLTCSSAPQRLALYLLRQSDTQGLHIELPLSQRQLASRLGVRAETLSRLFSDWQTQGFVSGRGREWIIHDVRHLKQLTDGAQRMF